MISVETMREYARMMREEGVVSLVMGDVSLTLGSLPIPQVSQPEKPDLDALFAGIPDDPLKDPVTFGRPGVPSFVPIPTED